MKKNKERNATHGRFITAKRLFSVAVSHTGLSTRSAFRILNGGSNRKGAPVPR
jgi:hypothetical protein